MSNIRKILTLFLILGMMSSIGFAEEVLEDVNLGSAGVEWKFKPEVESRLGYNIDSQAYGLKGSVVTDISASFYDKDTEFVGEGDIYGKIKINDLEIEVDQDYSASGNAYGGDRSVTGILNVNWESVTAWVYMGPVYFKMGNLNNEEVRYVETINDEDFSVVNYSVIPPYQTANRSGQKVNSSTLVTAAVTETQGTNNNQINPFTGAAIDNNVNVLVFGYEIPDVVVLELGAQTYFHYEEVHRQTSITTGNNAVAYNPFIASFLADVKAIKNTDFKFKVSAGNGNNTVRDAGVVSNYGGDAQQQANIDQGFIGFMTENNPITLGLQGKYTIPMGDMNFVPALGGEVQLEEKRKAERMNVTMPWDVAAGSRDFMNLADETKVLTYPFEIALGLTLNWKSLGLDSDEDSHIDVSPGDVNVTDGVSLSLIYGMNPSELAGLDYLNYFGAQVSLWDSEASDKPGIIPGLKASLVANINYSLGGTYDKTDLVKEAIKKSNMSSDFTNYDIKKVEEVLADRIDVGVAAELRYVIEKVEPYVGVLLKGFDITNGEDTTTVENVYTGSAPTVLTANATNTLKTSTGLGAGRYGAQGDFRLKIGTDFKIADKVTVNGEWVSGNLFNPEGNDYTNGFDGTDFFYNQIITGTPAAQTHNDARLGQVSVGLKVAF